MSILYSIKEAFAGFSKARVSTFITIFSNFFLIFILATFVILSSNVFRIVDVLNADYDMQAYLANTLSDADIAGLKNELQQIADVQEVRYISKEDAAKEFKKMFGDDIFDALGDNPLPASFVILIKKDSRTKLHVQRFADDLQQKNEIDEVVLHQEALDALVKFSRISRIVLYALFVIVFLGSLFLISNTIRLIIMARRPLIDTMQLIGATNAFIRRPFIIEGVLQGLLGGLGAALLVFMLMKIVALQWPGLILMPRHIYFLLILSGVFFGYVGSMIAVKRFL